MLAVYLFRATSGAHHQEGLVMTLTASSSSRAVTNSPVVVALDYHNRDDALSFVDKSKPITKDDVERLLQSHGQGGKISADALLQQIEAFRNWLNTIWPEHAAFPEFPVQSVLPNGQVMNGRIDLLLDTPSGWVLIDHKSNPQGASVWDDLAQKYAGQLNAYARAITRATGRPVIERWLFLPVSGCGLKV